ncbi:hypothetical protein COCNU_scaffold001936G000020 [Cocos nucifera]|nr:hypothetical protein [Cocos nucifera]
MLSKGLQAHKRKGKLPNEASKKARVATPCSAIPITATAARKIPNDAEVAPVAEVVATDGTIVPPTSSGLSTKVRVLELPVGEKKEKRKEK